MARLIAAMFFRA